MRPASGQIGNGAMQEEFVQCVINVAFASNLIERLWLRGSPAAYLTCNSLDTFPGGSLRPSDDSIRCSAQGGFRSLKLSRQPDHRVRFPVDDRERRFAVPGHRVACDAPRHGRPLYYSVFVTWAFALIGHGLRSDHQVIDRNCSCCRGEGCA